MGHRFSSLISPPLGILPYQLPLTFGLLLGLLFFFLTLSYLLWALSSQHKIEPWFPSLALPALHHRTSPPCLSLGLLLGSIATTQGFSPSSHYFPHRSIS